MGITQCVRRAAKQNARGRATVFGKRARCWDEFEVRVARLAGGLQSLGVRPGERVAVRTVDDDSQLTAARGWQLSGNLNTALDAVGRSRLSLAHLVFVH
jgi:non-ribosomal peptide synthetase component F